MKNKIFALLTAIMMCFAFAGCGGADSDKEAAGPEKAAPTSIIGDWECVDVEMTDNGETISKKDLEKMLGMKVKKMMNITAYGDGTAEMTIMGDSGSVTWTEADGTYTIITGSEAEDGSSNTAVLKDSKLILTIKDNYSADDKKTETSTTYTLKYIGKKSKLINGGEIKFTDDETRAMSNYMNEGQYLVVDDVLYGCFGGKKFGEGKFQFADITDGDKADIKNKQVIRKDVTTKYLTEHEGYIYGILNNAEIVKVKAGETKYKTIYEGGCDYLQIIGGEIYFADENYKLCKMNLNGKKKETVFDKEQVYFPYFLSKNVMIYQNDPDNESLHLYNYKTGEDTKLNDVRSYRPVLCGDYLYYVSAATEDKFYFNRMDMYSGKVETTEEGSYDIGFFIEDGKIAFANGGAPAVKVDEWNQMFNKNFGGEVMIPKYSDGHIRILAMTNGDTYICNDDFNKNYEHSNGIGYCYVKQ